MKFFSCDNQQDKGHLQTKRFGLNKYKLKKKSITTWTGIFFF